MSKIRFDFEEFYHIYNHSIGSELLFRNNNDYDYFILKMKRYLDPFCQIIAYCLLPNHFHILIKVIKPVNKNKTLEQTIKNFFNSYTRSYNSIHKRMGRLFRHGYKSKNVNSEEYLKWVIYYIHRNPVHHGLVDKCNNWKYSSYNSILHHPNSSHSLYIFEIFGDKKEFKLLTKEMTISYLKEKQILDQIEFV